MATAMATAMQRVLRGLLLMVRPALFVVVVVAVLGYFVLPTRTFMDQRTALADTRVELDEMYAANEVLEDRIVKLHSPQEIERLARRDFSLIYPGEEAYAILPPPPEPVTLPNAWPFNVLSESLD